MNVHMDRKLLLFVLTILFSFVGKAQDGNISHLKHSFYDGTSVIVPEDASPKDIKELASTVRPSARQLRWQKYGMLGFIHFNLNTFYGREWGTGKEDLSAFNPEQLDAEQWISAFKSAGIQSIILVCKHHDGFCLWPSSFRERSVKNTPWKNGKGNVVREFMDACRKEGIRTCIYYSPWDMQEPYGEPEYNDLMVNELRELLTNYGNIDLVWFDGAGIDEKTSGKKMDFDWPRIYSTIRTLQPQALISGAGPDIRWVGNEGGRGRFTEWSVQGIQLPEADFAGFHSGVPLMARNLGQIEQLKGAKQLAWYPARGGLPVRHGWFWKADQKTRTLDYMVRSYFETVGQNSNLLVNLSPDNRGLIPDEDVVLLSTFGEYLKSMYKRNFANGAVAKSNHVKNGGYASNYLFDNDLRTCWLAPEQEITGEIVVELYGEQTFNVVKLQENIADFGQRVESFEVDAWIDSEWKTIGKGTTIGLRRLLRVPSTTTDRLRIKITDSRNNPSLSTLELYHAPELKPGPEISKNKEGNIVIDGKGMTVYYTTDGSSPWREQAEVYQKPFKLPAGGKVRAVVIHDEQMEWNMESTKVIGIDSKKWIIKGGDNSHWIADNDPSTLVKFNLKKKSDNAFTIKLPEQTKLSGFGYLPPEGAPDVKGRIEAYTFYMKNNKGVWELVKSGKFGNIDNNPIERKIYFENPVSTKEVKFEINNATRKQQEAVVAEFSLF